MKKKSKWQAGSVILFALVLLLAIPFISMLEAQAFTDGYTTTDGNALRFEVKQKKASSSATVKYETVNWYLFKNQLDIYYADSSAWGDEAFMVTTTRVARTDPDSAGIFWDTMEMDAASFVSELEKLYSRSELINGVTMFASRTLQKVNGSGTKLGGPYYNYTDFSSAESWSDGTLWAVSQGYNIPIWIQLSSASFNVRFVEIDENGKQSDISQPESFTFSGATVDGENVGSEVIYGEKLSFGSASYTGKDYKYKGYQWTSMSGSSVTAGSPGSITVSNTYAPSGIMELTFYFEVQPEPTQLPFLSPTPEPTQAPDATATPTPTPTPTNTPAPTQQPTESYSYDYKYTRYFTTDKGHYIGEVADSTSYKLASQTAVDGGGTVSGSQYTSRDNSYLVGSDSSGNTWYFIASGTNATYVHPKKYNGYEADSANVKYITELVFPSKITYGGTTYTVTHIGGGTAKYKTEKTNNIGSGSTYLGENYYTAYGSYFYDYDVTASNTRTWKHLDINYNYGVLGNGQIVSEGIDSVLYMTTFATDDKYYYNNYYFYNTTLKKVVIPSTVTEIGAYAFDNCRALETIEGGDGLVTIGSSAFKVFEERTPVLSRTWTTNSKSCYDYYYYNLDYSTTAVTDTMKAWETASRLSGSMTIPVFPVLKTISYRAFMNHYNIDNVDLSVTISTIAEEAFMGCELENIRIPNASCSIYDRAGNKDCYATLGTKGYMQNGTATAIHTVPDSAALSYGLKYDGYYRLYCGYPITYKPNGGTPDEDVELYSALHIQYLEGIEPVEYMAYEVSSSSSTSYWPDSDYQYASYLDEDGVLYRIDKLNNRATVVSAGTTFTELFTVGDGVAHYAWDSNGNLWFSGQYMDRKSSSGSWYSWYSSMYDWRKIALPSNVAEIQFGTTGIFILDTEGYTKYIIPGTSSSGSFNKNGDILFKCINVAPYDGDTSTGEDSMLVGITTDNRVVYTREDGGYGFELNGWLSSLTAEDYAENTTMTSAIASYNIVEILECDGIYLLRADSGQVILWKGSYWTQYNTISGYNITEMEYLLKYYDSGTYYSCVKMKDASGNLYLAIIYSSGSVYYKVHKLGGAGVELLDVWDAGIQYASGYSATDDYSSTTSYAGVAVWTSDGYLARYNHTGYSESAVKYSSAKFVKVLHSSDNIYGLTAGGIVYSGGSNEYGQLGTYVSYNSTASYGYRYAHLNDALYLKQAGTRIYTDIYHTGGDWVLAKGEDGTIYYTGSYDGNEVKNFTALDSSHTWPSGTESYIKGYDYDTEIAYGMFAKTGSDFTGWNTAADGTGTGYQPGDMVDLDAALTLYAQWGAKSKHIMFHPNGGTGYMPSMTFPFTVTSATLDKNTFTRSGYEFVNWNTKADGSGTTYADEAVLTNITAETIHLYAQWNKKTITYTLVYMTYPFGSQSNTAWKTKTLTDAQTETVEGAPYTVSGTYTVSYSINKPSTMSTTPVMDTLTSANTSTTAPSFDSWELYKQVDSELVYRGREYIPGVTISKLTQTSGDIFYLYPSWGGANASVLLPDASCEGYDFLGWSETSSGITKIYPVYGGESDEVSVYTPVKDTTLYAVWEPKQYEITLDGQSATTQPQTSVTMNFDAACPAVAVPTRDQYVFQGYFTEPEGGGTQYYKADGTSEQIWRISNGSVTTLYAYWVPDKAISYNANGGTGTMATTWLEAGKSEVTLAANAFTRTGYTFSGWNTRADGTGTSYSDKATVTGITGQMTVYAQWTPNEYDLTLDPNGGVSNSIYTGPLKVYYETSTNNDISAYKPTKTGYTFQGWWDAATYGNIMFSATGTCANTNTYWKNSVWVYFGDVTAYAHWSPNTYTVTLEQDNATTKGTASVTATYDAPMPSITPPARTYTITYNANGGSCTETSAKSTYTFAGYYKELKGKGNQYYTSTPSSARDWDIDADTTLHVHWTDGGVVLPTPTKSGYQFGGWSTDSEGNTIVGSGGSTYYPEADVTLYAIWTVNSFNLTLNGNGGTINGSTTQTLSVTYQSSLNNNVSSYIPEKEGYSFTGYNTKVDGTGTPVYNELGANKNDGTYWKDNKWAYLGSITVYAQWKANSYVVEFDPDGGIPTPFPTITPTIDEEMPAITPPTKEFTVTYNANGGTCGTSSDTAVYTFCGFFTGKNGTGTKYYNADGTSAHTWDIMQNTTLYAKWTSASVKFPTPTRTGYTFQGWYTAKSDGTLVGQAGAAYTPTTNITVYAQWKANTYNVDFDVQIPDTTPTPTPMPTVTPTYDEDMPPITPPTLKYTVTYNANGGTCGTSSNTAVYTFGGFFTGKNGTGTKYYNADGTSARIWDIAQSTTLYAKWTSASVKFPTPTRTGYTFQGWYTAASGGTLVGNAGEMYTPTADITVYAQWELDIYQVEFDQQGGNPTPAPTVMPVYGEDMPAVVPPTRKYTVTYDANGGFSNTSFETITYEFGGYFTGKNGTGTQYYNADGTSARKWDITKDTTLYAKWTSVSVKLPTPTRTGYTFQGWYTAASSGTLVGKSGTDYTPTADITLYAQWKPNTYNIEFDQQGGTPTPAPTVTPTYDADMPAVVPPTRKYMVTYDANGGNCSTSSDTAIYTFGGYFTQINGGGVKYYNANGTPTRRWDIAQNTILYAKWTSASVKLPTPTRENYTFLGWFTQDSEGTLVGAAEATYTPTADITLYAQWKKNRKDIEKAEISIFSIDPAYIVNANLKEDPELPTLEWREYGDTMLEISVKTIGYFDYAVLKAPWESEERVFYWDEGVYSEDSETWTKNENIVFWRSQLRYPEEEDKVRNYPGYNNQTYTITIEFYIDDQVVIEYKVGLYMVSWLVWREEIHPSREGGSWDFNGDGIPDRWPFENGK